MTYNNKDWRDLTEYKETRYRCLNCTRVGWLWEFSATLTNKNDLTCPQCGSDNYAVLTEEYKEPEGSFFEKQPYPDIPSSHDEVRILSKPEPKRIIKDEVQVKRSRPKSIKVMQKDEVKVQPKQAINKPEQISMFK